MGPRRIVQPSETCAIRVDGEEVRAVPGEPVAVSLAAAGRVVLGRSIKYHRPRGATCYSGKCDGCLMRVDGTSSVMTCMVPAREGMVLETQNVVGSARHDLLAATDWFFPHGMDHHHMFTWSKAANQMMQKVARRIAGIGKLPSSVVAPAPPRELACELLVVGGGPAGLTAAAEAARGGLSVVVLDEAPRMGGHLVFLPGDVEHGRDVEGPALELADRLVEEARAAGATLLAGCSAVGAYDAGNSERGAVEGAPEHTVLAISEAGALVLRPERLIVATGIHEGACNVPGNDIPGVLGIRAAARLLAHGVLPGERVALCGKGHWAEAVAVAIRGHGAEVLGPFPLASVRRIRGRSTVKGVDVAGEDGAEQRLTCDAVALSGPRSGAYEIGMQAGAQVSFDGDGFILAATAADGATASPFVRAVGQCAGVVALPEGMRQARAAGRAVVAEARGGRHA